MGSMTIRDVPDEVMRRLDERASVSGRSREAEIRSILADSVAPKHDWAAFEGAILMLRRRFAVGTVGDSVEELAEARAERYGHPPSDRP